MIRRRSLHAAALALAMAALPAVVAAHPLGNFSINHYARVTVSPERVRIDLVVDAAEIPTIAAVPSLDRDGDGSVSGGELRASEVRECLARAEALRVVVGGQELSLTLVSAALELRPGAGALQTLRTTCALHGSVDGRLAATTTVEVADTGDGDRLGWREIVVNGDGVVLGDPTASTDVSQGLTVYPDDLLERPLDERSALFTVTPGREPTPVSAGDTRSSSALRDPGPLAVDSSDLTAPVAIVGLVLAAISGAGHALTPGHGKTLMAAYLVGTRGRPRDALLLALAVTVSHTAGVLILAGIVLVAGNALPADRLYPVLSAVSGAIVIGIGVWLLLSCLRRRRSAMAHIHDHDRAHPHSHPHPHGEADAVGVSRAGLVAIGLAGGMIPSTAALVLLLGAIAAGQPGYGVALAAAFGLGMAAVLVALGLLIVRGRSRVTAIAARLPGLVHLAPAVPWAAAIVVVAGGVALTGAAVAAVI